MKSLKKKIIMFISFSLMSLLLGAANEKGSSTFDLVLNKVTPDYFRFVNNNSTSTTEIGTEGITFSIPDPAKNNTATVIVSVEYDIRSNSILTLHRSSGREWGSTNGYMLVGEKNVDSGLNYDLQWNGKSSVEGQETISGTSIISVPSDRRNQVDLTQYDIIIYEPGGTMSHAGIVDFILTMNPPEWDDGGTSYLSDVYTGYLTMSLTAK